MGVLQQLEEQERATKAKIRERAQAAVAAGYERRSLVEVQKSTAASRARTPSSRSDGLLRPTTVSQNKRKNSKGPEVKEVEDVRLKLPEDTEESRAKWEKIHSRNSSFLQDRQKYLEEQRRRKEEQTLEGCTFEPQTCKGQKSCTTNKRGPSAGATMFERTRQMENRKQERMQKIRQELFEKEMSQCSFQPRIIGPGERGSEPRILGPDERRPSISEVQDTSSRRPSTRSSGDRQFMRESQYSAYSRQSMSMKPPRPAALGSHACHPAVSQSDCVSNASEATEGSEYWDGRSDTTQGMPARNEEPEVLQQLQERRRLLEETLSPDPASSKQISFGEALADHERQFGTAEKLRLAPAAAVAEAVDRMEALLLGDYDFSDLEDDYQDAPLQSDEAYKFTPTKRPPLPRLPVSPSRGGG